MLYIKAAELGLIQSAHLDTRSTICCAVSSIFKSDTNTYGVSYSSVVRYSIVLEFTLLGHCLRRSSFKMWVAHGALSPADDATRMVKALHVLPTF